MGSPRLEYDRQSNSFVKLAPKVQKWIWKNNWKELNEVQEKAIQEILSINCDLIISSPTASGKTEATFLPIFTLLDTYKGKSVKVLYISPLKALINDQFERLYDLANELQIKIIKWHGDVNTSRKKRFMHEGAQIVQITPESLESFLITKTQHFRKLFYDLEFIVIDELHYFMNTPRGMQLLSLLNRI